MKINSRKIIGSLLFLLGLIIIIIRPKIVTYNWGQPLFKGGEIKEWWLLKIKLEPRSLIYGGRVQSI